MPGRSAAGEADIGELVIRVDPNRVLDVAWRFGAAPYPVGSQSRFETNVLIYRLSRAMCEARPDLAERMIRISPFRAGPDTVLRVLGQAIAAAREAGPATSA